MRLNSQIYKEWLHVDVKPGEVPDHYTLLGIPPGENDISVIESALNVKFALLRKVDVSSNFDEFREILSQLETARSQLISPVRVTVCPVNSSEKESSPQKVIKETPSVTEPEKEDEESGKPIFNTLHFNTLTEKFLFLGQCILAFCLGLCVCFYMMRTAPRDPGGRVIFHSQEKNVTVEEPIYNEIPGEADVMVRPNVQKHAKRLLSNLTDTEGEGSEKLSPREPVLPDISDTEMEEDDTVLREEVNERLSEKKEIAEVKKENSRETNISDNTRKSRSGQGGRSGFGNMIARKKNTQKSDAPETGTEPFMEDKTVDVTKVAVVKKGQDTKIQELPKPDQTKIPPYPPTEKKTDPYMAVTGKKRLPVPHSLEVSKIKQVLYREYVVNAKTPEKERALVELLCSQATAATMDPAKRYAYLDTALSVATKSCDIKESLRVVELLNHYFDISLSDAKYEVFHQIALEFQLENSFLKQKGKINTFIRMAEQTRRDYVAQSRFDLASQLFDSVYDVCRYPNISSEIRKHIFHIKSDMNYMWERFQVYQEARTVLAENPSDETANMTVGIWLCEMEESLQKALPYLAQGTDKTIKSLAARELEIRQNPRGNMDQELTIADNWWNVGKEKDFSRKLQDVFCGHAVEIYQKVLPQIEDQRMQTLVSKRIDQHTEGEPTNR
ncbi:MAG: hypothetical protein Q4C96_03785 [Planctomycetia bacterium]|nr:hypothetical protein [Planctomycetia bacterium]